MVSGEAFRLVSHKIVYDPNYCQNTGHDDVDLAVCLRNLGVRMTKSLDDLGRERFIPVNFLTMYIGPIPGWMFANSVRKPELVCLFLLKL